MPGLDPGIHQKKRFVEEDGLHRNSGLPEFRIFERRKSGEPDFAVSSPAMTRQTRARPS
jgi:hypothetical protein